VEGVALTYHTVAYLPTTNLQMGSNAVTRMTSILHQVVGRNVNVKQG